MVIYYKYKYIKRGYIVENLGSDIFGRKEPSMETTTSVSTPAGYNAPMGSPAIIKVVGVGGGGGNAIESMIKSGLTGVEFWSMNTDLQALSRSSAKNKLQLGAKLTNGLGAGGEPQVGEKAADETATEIGAALEGADMVFVTAGMGGGTGTGAAPVVARIAKELGILTVGVVTKPFGFEGKRRMAQANQGLERLREAVDSLLVIPNDKLFDVCDKKTSYLDAFVVVNEVLVRGVKGISDIITKPGLINVDFADVRSVMLASGSAVMGIGKGEGEGRATEAAKIAINSKLLENSIQGASGVVVNFTGGPDMTLFELADAIRLIEDAVLDDAKLIVGTSIDNEMNNEVSITVIATGFELKPQTANFAAAQTPDVAASPSIDSIFSNLNTAIDTPAPAGSSASPMLPPIQQTFTNIEIPDFLKK